MSDDPFFMRRFRVQGRGGVYEVFGLDAVPTFRERIVPPAGEDYAFEVQHYKRRVEVYVSPTGRSVRVWVDGREVEP